MVYTALSKKQYSFVEIHNIEDAEDYINELVKNRQHVILYPINTEEQLDNVSDLLDEKWQSSLLSEIENVKKPIRIINAKRSHGKDRIIKNVQLIEHLGGPTFRIKGENGELITFNFSLFDGKVR